MRGYEEDEYEDYSEYEEEGEEQEEYEEEERKPTHEELQYLELRQRLKERIRQKMMRENSSSHTNSQDKKTKLPSDNYGSFFGPSQPVIAQRVIQESKSLLETQHLANRVSNSQHGNKKSPTTAAPKSAVHGHVPVVTNNVKTKVEKLKNARDYSFLLSDDAEPPAPAEVPPPRNGFAPNSARSAQVAMKRKSSLSDSDQHVDRFSEKKKPASVNSQMHSKGASNKLSSGTRPNLTSASKPNLQSVDRRRLDSGTGRAMGSDRHVGPGRSVAPGRPLGTDQSVRPGRSVGSGGPMAPKVLQSKMPIGKVGNNAPAPGSKSLMHSLNKPSSSKLQSTAPKQRLEHKIGRQEPMKGKLVPKPPVSSSRPQNNKPPPLKQNLSRPTSSDHRSKKRPARPFSDDEADEAIDEIRKMFRYNPKKFAEDDADSSDMEANFDDIMREEQRSARIARKEDEEQLRMIEEEEERERRAHMKRLQKKRKL